MAESLGKKFEKQLAEQLEKNNICFDRLKDDMSGFKGSANICDFITFYKGKLFYLECKTIRSDTFNYNLIRDTQYYGLLKKSVFKNVIAGVLLWFVDRDITVFIPIKYIQQRKREGNKSFSFNNISEMCTVLTGRKKRVFFEYDLKEAFDSIIELGDFYEY